MGWDTRGTRQTASSAREVRALKNDLWRLRQQRDEAFFAGELRVASRVAWEELGLPSLEEAAREQLEVAVEAATERAATMQHRQNTILSIIFGLIGATALASEVTKPLWAYFGLPSPPKGLEGPSYFVVSGLVVLLLAWAVPRLAKKEGTQPNRRSP